MKPRDLILLLVVFLLIGLGVQRARSKTNEQNDKPSTHQATKSKRHLSESRRRLIDSLGIGADAQEGQEGWLRWIAFLENASLSDLPLFLRQAGNNPSALRLIAEKWLSLDATNGFQYLLKHFGRDETADFVDHRTFPKLFFRVWLEYNSEEAIASLDQARQLPLSRNLREMVFREISRDDIQRGLELHASWELKSFLIEDYRDSPEFQEWVKANPWEATEQILSHPKADQLSHLIKKLSSHLAEEDPATALQLIFSKERDPGLAKEVLLRWGELDFSAASEWLSNHSDETQAASLTSTLVEAWAKEDPESALSWSQENLSGQVASEAIQKILNASAFSKQANPRELLAQIESQSLRNQTAVNLVRNIFKDGWDPNNRKYREIIGYFHDIEDPYAMGQILHRTKKFWLKYDREGYYELLSSPKGYSLSPSSYRFQIRSLAYDNIGKAIELVSNAPEQHMVHSIGGVFGVWHKNNRQDAESWAAELAPSDPRRPHLIKEVVSAFINNDAEVVSQGINDLSPTLRTLARDFIIQKKEENYYRNLDHDKVLRGIVDE